MPKLNQVVALVAARKAESEKHLTDAYHKFQKGDLFSGFTRTYTARNQADTDVKPPERKNPQQSVREIFADLSPVLAGCWDAVATQDAGNTVAKADVRVGDAVVLEAVPVTTLLFLEHKLEDMKAFVAKLPVRDPAEEWAKNAESNAFATPPSRKESTKKVQKPIVLYDATDKHPAQTQLITEDAVVGYWDERKFSTAVSATDKDRMTAQVAKLAEAVKVAREEANAIPVVKKEVANKVLDFVFGDLLK